MGGLGPGLDLCASTVGLATAAAAAVATSPSTATTMVVDVISFADVSMAGGGGVGARVGAGFSLTGCDRCRFTAPAAVAIPISAGVLWLLPVFAAAGGLCLGMGMLLGPLPTVCSGGLRHRQPFVPGPRSARLRATRPWTPPPTAAASGA